MKRQIISQTVELSEHQLQQIDGGIGQIGALSQAEDAYGNKKSMENWMDYMAYHVPNHDALDLSQDANVFDFKN